LLAANQDHDDDIPPTPPERRIRAKLLDGTVVEYRELRPGMIFQAISPDGVALHPIDLEPNDETFAICDGEPEPAVQRGEGWQVRIWEGPLDVLKARSN